MLEMMIALHFDPRRRSPDRMNPRNASSSQIAGKSAITTSNCIVLGAVFRRDVGIRHVRLVFEKLEEAEIVQ